jgi:hypothetical protein
MAADTNTAYAVDFLVAFWTRPRTLSPRLGQLCSQLAHAVDPAGALAAAVWDDPDGVVGRIAVAVQAARESDGGVDALLEQFPRRLRQPNMPLPGGGGPPALRESRGRILLAVSDPTDLGRLRLGLEEREVREALDLSSGRARWAVYSRPALRLRDLTRALLDLQPNIVHFAGHGSEKGGLFLEDEAGFAQCVPPEAVAELFRLAEGAVHCVVLNACFSRRQARAISAYVPFVMGSPSTVDDKAAIAFSVGFYQTIGAGRDIAQAYNVGRAHMQGAGTAPRALPVLIQRTDVAGHGA